MFYEWLQACLIIVARVESEFSYLADWLFFGYDQVLLP